MTTQALSTLGVNIMLRNDISDIQARIAKVQHQVSTGKKADRYGDLGTQASLNISLHNDGEKIDGYQQTLSTLKVRLDLMDKNLLAIHDVALDIRTRAFGTQPFDTGRQDLINSARDALTSITEKLQLSVDGRQLFAGTKTDTAPMLDSATILSTVQGLVGTQLGALAVPPAAGTVVPAIQGAVQDFFDGVNPPTGQPTPNSLNFYAGGAKHAGTEIDTGYKLDYSITGDDPAFRDILTGLYMIASTPMPVDPPAAPGDISRADFDAVMAAAASKIGSGIDRLDVLTQQNGRNQQIVEDVGTRLDATSTIIKTQINDIEGADVYQASTLLAQLKSQLEATFSITGELRSLSLIDYLR